MPLRSMPLETRAPEHGGHEHDRRARAEEFRLWRERLHGAAEVEWSQPFEHVAERVVVEEAELEAGDVPRRDVQLEREQRAAGGNRTQRLRGAFEGTGHAVGEREDGREVSELERLCAVRSSGAPPSDGVGQ